LSASREIDPAYLPARSRQAIGQENDFRDPKIGGLIEASHAPVKASQKIVCVTIHKATD